MNEIIYYNTVARIIQHDMHMTVLYLIQLFSSSMVLIIIFHQMIRNGNLTEFGIFKKLERFRK